jgi:hypothetical protein
MYDIPLKFNVKKVLKYLFKEQELVKVDWSKVLLRSLHYANVDAVKYYLESDVGVIEVTTNRKDPTLLGKYTILNKGLDSLNKGLDSLRDLVKVWSTQDPVLLDKAVTIVDKLTESLSVLIANGKLYFCIDKQDVLTKTFYLISDFIRSTEAISDFLKTKKPNVKLEKIEESCNTLKDLLTGEYDKLLDSGHDRIEEWVRIKEGDFPDNRSDVTSKTAFSSMSVFFPRDGVSFRSVEDHGNVLSISKTPNLFSEFYSKLHEPSSTISATEEESSLSVIGDLGDAGNDE